MEGNGDGDAAAGGAGPSQTIQEVLAEVIGREAGVTAEVAGRAGALLQRIIDDTSAKVLAEAEKNFQAQLLSEKEKRREKERKRKPPVEAEAALSPKQREKKLRREARAAERLRVEEEKRKAAEREKKPKLHLNAGGAPLPKSYRLFRSQLGQILKSTFRITDYWGAKTDQEKLRIREQVKDRFGNGHFLDDRFLSDRISHSVNDRRNHMREKMRNYLKETGDQLPEELQAGECPDGLDPDGWSAWLAEELQVRAWGMRRHYRRLLANAEDSAKKAATADLDLQRRNAAAIADLQRHKERWEVEVTKLGKVPAKIKNALDRVGKRPEVTHRMGQGGAQRLKADFVSPPPPSSSCNMLCK